MNLPSSVFVGYLPKITAQREDLRANEGGVWLKNDIVEEICSVSDCISKRPEGWIDQWKHNALGFFDTEKAALSILPEHEAKKYDLYGYKLFPVKFDQGKIVENAVEVQAIENFSAYQFIGFDVISNSSSDFFECSPLSCNNGCDRFSVNRFCLIQNFEEAQKCCRTISEEIAGVEIIKRPDGIMEYHGKWEPGPYYLFEVFRKEK